MLFDHGLIYTDAKLYLYAALLPAIIVTVVFSAYLACSYLERQLKTALFLLGAAILALQGGQFLAAVAPPRELPFFAALQGASFCLAGPLFYQFAHAAQRKTVLKRAPALLLFLGPAAGVALALTNGYHGLFYKIEGGLVLQHGYAYKLIASYNCLCALAALLLLSRPFFRGKKERGNKRLAACAAAAVSLALGAAFFDFGLPRLLPFALVPLSLAAALPLLLLGALPLKNFQSLLTARINVFNGLNESVFIADRSGSVFYFNPTPENQALGLAYGTEVAALTQTPFASQPLLFRGGNFCAQGEFTLHMPEKRYFSYFIRPIYKGKKQRQGVLFSFRDITGYKALLHELETQRDELAAAAQKLRGHAAVVRQLTAEGEKNKISAQIQETVGACLRQIVAKLEKAVSAPQTAPAAEDGWEPEVKGAIACARQGLQEVRASVSRLTSPVAPEGENEDD